MSIRRKRGSRSLHLSIIVGAVGQKGFLMVFGVAPVRSTMTATELRATAKVDATSSSVATSLANAHVALTASVLLGA